MRIVWYRNSQQLQESEEIQISESQTTIRNLIRISILKNYLKFSKKKE